MPIPVRLDSRALSAQNPCRSLRLKRSKAMSDWIKRFLPFVSLVLLCVVIAALEPRFLSAGNLAGVARQTAVIIVIAMGMTIVMVSGGIDLSVGSVMALSGVAGALAMVAGAPVALGIAAAIATGTLCGLASGAA